MNELYSGEGFGYGFFCTFAVMNWTIIIIETIILTLAFTAMILIPLVKNPVWWIADYPEDIQEEYFKTSSVGVCSSASSLALSVLDYMHGYFS